MAISTVSYTKTPQAGADNYSYTEDELLQLGSLYNAGTNTLLLDVMANDLGGNAKKLYSIDDGGTDALKQLLSSNVSTGWEPTANGGQIRICAGKIEYQPDLSKFGGTLNGMGADATLHDSFVYAIQLGNGTLAYATVTVDLAGSNDGPTVSGAITASTAEDNAAFDIDLLTYAKDVDVGDMLSAGDFTYAVDGVAVAAMPAGLSITGNTLTVNPGDAAFQHLATSAQETITVSYLISDGHGGSVAQTATIKVTGVNDAPTVDLALTASGTEDTGVVTVELLAGADDVDDGASLSVVGLSSLTVGVTLDADGKTLHVDTDNAAFDHFAADTEHDILVTYQVSDEFGEKVAQTATVTITGTNDGPTVDGAIKSTGTEDSGVVTVDLLAGAGDVDDGAVLSVVAGADVLPDGVSFSGSELTVDTGSNAFQHLADGKTQDVTVHYQVSDEHGATVDQTATVTITGVNDEASISGDTLGSLGEDDTTLVSGQLTVSDVDDLEDHTQAASGTTALGSYTVDANGNWSYTVDNSAVQYLNAGESTTDTFDVKSLDGSETQTVTVTINGANEAPAGPVAAPTVFTGTGDSNDKDESGSAGTQTLTGDQNPNTLYGGAGADTINGRNGDDALFGGSGADSLSGDSANDTLYGGSGNDTLEGNQGNDKLYGGFGADQLTGNPGDDTFVFIDTRDTGDTITDYTHTIGGQGAEVDHLDFSAIDANSSTAGVNDAFVSATSSTTLVSHGVIWFNDGTNTFIQVDTDGDINTAEMQIKLTGMITLTASDFTL